MGETENILIEKLTGVMTEISLDIREIKTTLSHFGEKFDRVQQDISEVRNTSKENEHEIETMKIMVNTIEHRSTETKEDVQILFRKFKERDTKGDNDRKWLVGTVITVVALGITIISFAINFI
ncbi:hypothetical protein [Sporosarcina psychrophila]|uniref:Coiled-coil protein SlyX n=1 Tax=Sporosarcina psychrophila TaxID=1476 RepID=A0ABV2KBD9_SPOPS